MWLNSHHKLIQKNTNNDVDCSTGLKAKNIDNNKQYCSSNMRLRCSSFLT